MPFYKSVWKFIFPIHGICFLTDPAIAIFVHGIISEPRNKITIHSRKAPVCHPSVSRPELEGSHFFAKAHCNADRIDSVTRV